jgi:hypothetical protein
MSKLLNFLFRRQPSRMERAGMFARRVGPKRAGIGGGGLLAALAIPYIIRKVRARRAEQAFRPAGA